MSEFAAAISSLGISNHAGISMAWTEVVAVSAHKIDAMTKVLTYLTFDSECGEYIEFMSDEPEFEMIVDALDDYIELPDGWKDIIERASPADAVLDLWRRIDG